MHVYVSLQPSWFILGAMSAVSHLVFFWFCFNKRNEIKKEKKLQEKLSNENEQNENKSKMNKIKKEKIKGNRKIAKENK